MKKYIVLTLVMILYLSSCKKKDTTVDQVALDQQTIASYISNNKLTMQSTSSGIYYMITSAGLGNPPASNANVTVSYKGYLTDGSTVFAQSPTTGNTFNMALIIEGLQQSIPLFKKGGKGTILIPSSLGYGIQNNGLIPANSVLVFDIELLDIR